MSEPDGRADNERLKALEVEEREVSALRRKLHDRIAMFPEAGGELERREREVSARRRELHEEIDALRGRMNLPSGPRPASE